MRRLTFDDVLIEPKFSELSSRSEVDLSTDKFYYPMRLPIFSANMESITSHNMCSALSSFGALGVLHRFFSREKNVKNYENISKAGHNCGVSVGLGPDEIDRVDGLLAAGANLFFLDVAHGAQRQVVEQYNRLKYLGCPFVVIGNFATGETVERFAEEASYPLDAVKVGIGPGSVCTTRVKTGVGMPQISAIYSVKETVEHKMMTSTAIIADGGMKTPGDIAKSLAAGADAVMLGGMFAGTTEAAGKSENGYKTFKGSAFKTKGDTDYCTSEGVETRVEIKGSVKDILKDIEGGLRSAFTYVGAKNLSEFYEKAKFITVSSSTPKENKAHYGE